MRLLFRVVLGLFLGLRLLSAAGPGMEPAPSRWATDHAGFIREETRAKLDGELEAYERATGHQVILWIGESLDGDSLEDFAARAV